MKEDVKKGNERGREEGEGKRMRRKGKGKVWEEGERREELKGGKEGGDLGLEQC